MFNFAINAGHWNGTYRGVPADLSPTNHPNEWQLNDRVARAIIKYLSDYNGITIRRIDDPTGETFIEDDERMRRANTMPAQFYLGIHHNGGINGGSGGGIVSYSYLKPKFNGDTSAEWSQELYDSLIRYTGLKGNRANPVAKADLFEVRDTKMPAVLLELGFMDSTTDLKSILASNWPELTAKAIGSVIVRRAKLTKKAEVMKKGDKNLGVYALKKLLMLSAKFGLVPNSLADDGVFGDGTEKDVAAIQSSGKLVVTGQANEEAILSSYVQTLDALNAERKKTAAQLDAAEDAENAAKQAKAELVKANAKIEALQKKLDSIIVDDVNGDGSVDMKDVLALRQIIAGVEE